MALRPHAGVKYRFREIGSAEWQEAAWSNYADEETEESVMKALLARCAGCEVELIEVRWKLM